MDDSPWLTAREAVDYARRSYETIQRACAQYHKSGGTVGLRNSQPKAHGKYSIQKADVDRWLAGERPLKPRQITR